MKREKTGNIVLVLFLVTLFWSGVVLASDVTKPKLNLFPVDVAEHLSKTGAVAGAMENSLKGTIQNLEIQSKLYTQTGCEGSSDPGCEEIAKQLGSHYMEMLTIMKENFPEMKQSIKATNEGIEKNLRKELGKKTSPADIQRLLANQGKVKVFKGRYTLSSRFAQYHKMISSGKNNSLAALAAEIYLDSKAVLDMIELMEAEIAQQETLIIFGEMYGTLTPEMTSSVEAVKAILFGEVGTESALLEARDGDAQAFRSPLEMD